MKLRPAVIWRMRTWPGPGSPTSTCSHLRTSGPPALWIRIACGIALALGVRRAKKSPAAAVPGGAPPFLAMTPLTRGVTSKGRKQEQCDDVGDLDHRIDGRSGGVLV